jgi:ribosome-associated toxin RatA of RatAB toxin-antitoxin module
MIQVDRCIARAGLSRVFACAADVERWPEWLDHYRWVRFLERRPDGGLVEMAAWRRFTLFRYPTWWVSEMHIDWEAPAVRYRHVRGITRGMDVTWTFQPSGGAVAVTVTHTWDGPAWPLVRAAAAGLVIGPVFIHAIAQRTLAGIARTAERQEERGAA